jgi:hypothetical protein
VNGAAQQFARVSFARGSELMKKNDSSDVVRKVQPSEGVLLDPSLPLDQLIAW